ncbi:MAG TPA: hypothetical protein VE521_00905 [Nitrososphaera sp.]|nr:hypothetical protein [Nitrososphaera sp.]
MSETMNIDDFIVLGNAAPDEMKDFRTTVCYAGFSEKHGMIRLYPVPPTVKMGRWFRVEVPVERNPQDVREESWKIRGSRDEWSQLHKKIKVGEQLKREQQIALLRRLEKQYGVDCIQDLNDQRLSLGFIKPKTVEPYYAKRENQDASKQTTLFGGEPFWTIRNYGYQPRLKYTCQACKLVQGYHDQQILEWGVYEWMRNNPDKLDDVWKNLPFGDPEYETSSLLVGNQARYLNSFLVISIFRFKKTPEQARLFD